MKQRLGLILALVGVILLMDPTIELEAIWGPLSEWLLHYWPILLILIGAFLITPKKKKKRSTR